MFDELLERCASVPDVSDVEKAALRRSRSLARSARAVPMTHFIVFDKSVQFVGQCAVRVELYTVAERFCIRDEVEYCGRRDVVVEELNKIPGFSATVPGGAFYMTCKLPVEDIEDFLMFLLEEFEDNGESVMFAPAEGFYATPGLGKDEIRIAYVLKREDMKRGVELIRLGLEA